MTIYTIGHRATYEAALEQYGHLIKLGRREDYLGGYAFKTAEEARRRIDEAYPNANYTIWTVDAEWDRDTYPAPDGWWRYLRVDCSITGEWSGG